MWTSRTEAPAMHEKLLRLSLEEELHRQLYHTRIERARDRAEIRGADNRRGRIEQRCVQEIEDLSAELERLARPEPQTAHHREVNVAIPRSTHGITRRG